MATHYGPKVRFAHKALRIKYQRLVQVLTSNFVASVPMAPDAVNKEPRPSNDLRICTQSRLTSNSDLNHHIQFTDLWSHACRFTNVWAMPTPAGALALTDRQFAADWDGQAVVVVVARGDTPFPTVQRAWAAQGFAPQVLHTTWVDSGAGLDSRIYRMVRVVS